MCRNIFAIIILLIAFTLGAAYAADGASTSQSQTAKHEEEQHGHKAHHGGCLNAIDMCSVGHAEVKIEGDTLKLWFVGGENETGTAVRVPDKEIKLSVQTGDGKSRDLLLWAAPNELSEEEIGNCSHFEGVANWLKTAAKFDATGKVNFKGTLRNIKISYPGGYDPDDEKETAPTPKASPGEHTNQGEQKAK